MRLTRLAIATAPALFVLLWSTGFIGARYGLPYIEPLTFLAVRMAFVVLIMAAIAIIGNAQRPDAGEVGHSLVAGSLVHGLCLGGVFTAISQGVPVGISALILGTSADRDLDHCRSLYGREGYAGSMGWPCARACRCLAGAARPQHRTGRFCAWLGGKLFVVLSALRSARFIRSVTAVVSIGAPAISSNISAPGSLFALGAFAFETREIRWSGELIFALAWLVLVLSIAAVGLMYWLIRRSAATGFASLFYLVPAVTAIFAFILFGERLDALSVLGMVICAGGVLLANQGAAKPREL